MKIRLFLAFVLWSFFPIMVAAQTAAPTIGAGAYNPSAGGGGTPGGSNYSVQINSGGSFVGAGPGTSGQVLTSNGSSSAPTFQASSGGGTTAGTISGNNTLTASSPNYLFSTAVGTETLPSASTCLNKVFVIYNAAASGNVIVQPPAGDLLYYTSGTIGSWIVPPITSLTITAEASGVWYITVVPGYITPASAASFSAGGILYGNGGSNQPVVSESAAGTAGQFVLSGGTGAPTFSSSPTITHTIGGGTAPTVSAGTGAGTSPTISITGSDLDCKVTLTTGTTPFAGGIVFTITYGTPFGANPYIQMKGANAATVSLFGSSEEYPTPSTTQCVVNNAGTALTAATQYIWYVHSGG